MEKLELKHIVGYLPYGLKMELLGFPFTQALGKHYRTLELDCGHDFRFYLNENRVRPVLRPLSDLTKEIEVNGEKFVPTDILKWNTQNRSIDKIYFETVSYSMIQKLYEWHFDIHGLIEKGLAIDVNTLQEAEKQLGKKII